MQSMSVSGETNSNGTMVRLDHTGHTEVKWDPDNEIEVASAKASFDVAVGKGYLAFKLNADGSTGEQIRTFDPNAKQIVLRPQFRGG